MPRTTRKPYSRSPSAARRYRRRRLAAFVLVLAAAAAAVFLFSKPQAEPDGSLLPDAQQTLAPQPQFNIDAELAGQASLTKAFIYGTHLGLEGTLALAAEMQPQSAELLWYTMEGVQQSWPLRFETAEGVMTFSNTEKLNDGMELEPLAEAEGWLLLRVTVPGADGQAVPSDYGLTLSQQTAADLPFTYYTVTQNGTNRRIVLEQQTMRFADEALAEQSGLHLSCAAAPLPEDVYDIVIDPGHGGTDAGSLSNNMWYYEAEIVLDIALRTKQALEEMGYKVLITRDGTEDPKTMMAYTMYDEDGRVNVTAGSGAKLCLSVHLNSYDGYMEDDQGGVQIYAADNMDYTFAAQLAQSVAQHAGSYVSTMASYKVVDGVFCRVFTQGDSDELAAEGYEFNFTPYDIPAGTNYYYIIRETGGRLTGAYIDGRHPHYGENLYRDSAVGVESYLCELGYITLDSELERLLNDPQGYADGLAAAVHARFGTQ